MGVYHWILLIIVVAKKTTDALIPISYCRQTTAAFPTIRSSSVASTTDSTNDVVNSIVTEETKKEKLPPPTSVVEERSAASSSSSAFGNTSRPRNGVTRPTTGDSRVFRSGPTNKPRGPSRPYSGAGRSNPNNSSSGGSSQRRGGLLRLTRPLMLQRVVTQTPGTKEEIYAEAAPRERRPPPTDRRSDSDGQSRPPPRRRPTGAANDGDSTRPPPRRRPPATAGADVGFLTAKRTPPLIPSVDEELAEARRKRKRTGAVGAVAAVGTVKDTDARRENRKSSLRIQMGRKGHAAELSQRRSSLKKRDRTGERVAKAEAALERKTVYIPEGTVTVSELATIIDEKPIGIIKYLMSDLGIMASMTQGLDRATSIAVAEGFGKIVSGHNEEIDLEEEGSALLTGFVQADKDDESELEIRPPVVTIMGHVDHGKTSLLDAIRSTHVTAGEAGGITQHIAAYQVKHKEHTITFIDTPGHAAFTDMRERGANITDIVILVVAADDGVKQQTKDSIMCARQAGVPVVVAINKCDLETADPNRVQTELTAYDILTEDFGGDVLSAQISAKMKTGLDDLLDKVMLQAEIQDLKANPNRDAECIVVEAYIEKGLGTVATTLVKRGTLRVGDIFVAGETCGKVRALISTADDTRMEYALPSTPVKVVGFEGVPSAGDTLIVAPDEQTAREIAESRRRISREASSSSYQAGLMNSVNMAFGATKERREMCVVVKADVQGSAEALTNALRSLKLENDEATVTVKVLVSGTGEVSKSDIAIASVTPGTTVLAFNVASSMAAMDDARLSGIPIEYYNIIYDAIESVESRMQEVLSPTPEGEYTGAAIVQEVFNIGGVGNIAGCKCNDGTLRRGGNIRVMRGDKILTESKIKSLRNFKSEVDMIEVGSECGIGLLDFEKFEPGDTIECYVEKKK